MTRKCLFSFFFIILFYDCFETGNFSHVKNKGVHMSVLSRFWLSDVWLFLRVHVFPLANHKTLIIRIYSDYSQNMQYSNQNTFNPIRKILMNSTKRPSYDPKTNQLLHHKTRYDREIAHRTENLITRIARRTTPDIIVPENIVVLIILLRDYLTDTSLPRLPNPGPAGDQPLRVGHPSCLSSGRNEQPSSRGW